MRRLYTDLSAFRQPYKSSNVSFAGLGATPNQWASGRSYVDVSQYRMPYRSGYFQSGALRGVGDVTMPPYAPFFLFAVVGAGIGAGAAVLLKKKPTTLAAIGAGLGVLALYGYGV
jgi:hypothetical protein